MSIKLGLCGIFIFFPLLHTWRITETLYYLGQDLSSMTQMTKSTTSQTLMEGYWNTSVPCSQMGAESPQCPEGPMQY